MDTILLIPLPARGVSDAWGNNSQPEGTCPAGLNFLPVDRFARRRPALRPGLACAHQYAHGAGAVQRIFQTTFLDGSTRRTPLISVVAGNIYLDDTATGLGVTLATTGPIGVACGRAGKVFFVDGTNDVHQVALGYAAGAYTGVVSHLAATAATVPTGCTVACSWRGRLVLAGPDQNWYMSRPNCYTDWNYGGHDDGRAVAGNSAQSTMAGYLGDPVLALMPASDDVLLTGHDHRIFAFRGDPASGGSIVMVSDATGIMGPEAWCSDPSGAIWMVGQDGLYRYGDAGLEPIGHGLQDRWFAALDRSLCRILLSYDVGRGGLWVTAAPIATGAAVHLFYDTDANGFWPVQFPDDVGPTAACTYDGDAPRDRRAVFGGRSGLLYALDDGHARDQTSLVGSTVAISSKLWVGPIHPAGEQEQARITRHETTLGELPAGYAGDAWSESGDAGNLLGRWHLLQGVDDGNSLDGKLWAEVVDTDGKATTYRIDLYADAGKGVKVGHTANFRTAGTKPVIADSASGLGGSVWIDALGATTPLLITVEYAGWVQSATWTLARGPDVVTALADVSDSGGFAGVGRQAVNRRVAGAWIGLQLAGVAGSILSIDSASLRIVGAGRSR